jgi:hypothetical protein
MYPNEYLQEIHQVMLNHKEHLVVAHGEYNMAPVLALRWRDHIMEQVDIETCIVKLHGALAGLPDEMLREVLSTGRVVHGVMEMIATKQWGIFPSVAEGMKEVPDVPLEGIWLTLEQFHDPVGVDDPAELPKRGDLQVDFETNPESKVLEAITTYVIETGSDGLGEWARLTTCHRKVEGGGVEWLDTEIRRGDTDPIVEPECDWMIELLTGYVTRESLA